MEPLCKCLCPTSISTSFYSSTPSFTLAQALALAVAKISKTIVKMTSSTCFFPSPISLGSCTLCRRRSFSRRPLSAFEEATPSKTARSVLTTFLLLSFGHDTPGTRDRVYTLPYRILHCAVLHYTVPQVSQYCTVVASVNSSATAYPCQSAIILLCLATRSSASWASPHQAKVPR